MSEISTVYFYLYSSVCGSSLIVFFLVGWPPFPVIKRSRKHHPLPSIKYQRKYFILNITMACEAGEPGPAMCRICFDISLPPPSALGVRDALVSPCGCKGSMAFVHLSCLAAWRRARPRAEGRPRCEACREGYRFAGTSLWKLQAVEALERVPLRSATTFLLSLVSVVLLGRAFLAAGGIIISLLRIPWTATWIPKALLVFLPAIIGLPIYSFLGIRLLMADLERAVGGPRIEPLPVRSLPTLNEVSQPSKLRRKSERANFEAPKLGSLSVLGCIGVFRASLVIWESLGRFEEALLRDLDPLREFIERVELEGE